jgi:hypothetical protein
MDSITFEKRCAKQHINYIKIKEAGEICLCGHDALTHSCWVSRDGNGHGLLKPWFKNCDERYCNCDKYQRDNLRYLELKSEKYS